MFKINLKKKINQIAFSIFFLWLLLCLFPLLLFGEGWLIPFVLYNTDLLINFVYFDLHVDSYLWTMIIISFINATLLSFAFKLVAELIVKMKNKTRNQS